MINQKLWTQYQDSVLKKLRDQMKIQRWSTIAQKMALDFNLKGINGKQCKQRYKNVFDTNNEVLMWDYKQQQQLFMLHDQLGNKWAVIGQQLSDRSDNEVKNHFYTKFRKALRKLNKAIKTHFKKQFKQLRENILNKIIEGTEDKFKLHPIYDEQLSKFCSQLKNQLLTYSYDQVEYNPLMDIQNNRESLRYLIQSLTDFSKGYKRKPKRIRRASGQGIQIQEFNNSQLGQSIKMKSENSIFSSQIVSDCQSELNQSQQNCDIQENEEQMKQFNKRSLGMPNQIFGINFPSIKRQKINQVIILQSSADIYQMQQQKDPNAISLQNSKKDAQISKFQKGGDKSWGMMEVQDQNQIEQVLKKDGLLQQQEDIHNIVAKINKIGSSVSNFSSYSIEESQQNFFGDDSTLNMRIFTTGIGRKNCNQLQSSIDKSDKLFKSIQRDKALFQSLQSKKSDNLFRSIGR